MGSVSEMREFELRRRQRERTRKELWKLAEEIHATIFDMDAIYAKLRRAAAQIQKILDNELPTS